MVSTGYILVSEGVWYWCTWCHHDTSAMSDPAQASNQPEAVVDTAWQIEQGNTKPCVKLAFVLVPPFL